MSKAGEARREQIVAFIRGYTAEHGYAPAMKEIGHAVGLKSMSTVSAHLNRLRDSGRITYRDAVARSYVVSDK